MKFSVCCCLFVYDIYKLSRKTTFSFSRNVYRSKDVGYTFTLCTIDYFIHVCYSCVYNMIKIKRFNENNLSETLWPSCHSRLSDSYLSRMNNTAKTCFQNLKPYPMMILMQIMQCLFVVLDVLSNLSAISYTKIFIL